MALIQYTGLIAQIRGKLAGTVFSKFAGGFSVSRKANPRKRGSIAQQRVRNNFSAWTGIWRTLTQAIRDDWRFIALNTPQYNRLGELKPINGFAYYIQFNQFFAGFYPTPFTNPVTDLEPAYNIEFQASPASFSLTNEGFVLQSIDFDLQTISNSQYENLVLIYFSQPIPYDDFVYHGTWYKAGAVLIEGDEGIGADFQFSLEGVIMPAGFRSFEGAIHRVAIRTISINSAQFSPFVFEDINTVIVPPYEFPPFNWLLQQGDNYVLWDGIDILASLPWEFPNGTPSDLEDLELLWQMSYAEEGRTDFQNMFWAFMPNRPLFEVNNVDWVSVYPSSSSPSRIELTGDLIETAFGIPPAPPDNGFTFYVQFRLRHIPTGSISQVGFGEVMEYTQL